jgi:nucleoside-diphosphate-sugar epimerase
MTAAPGKSLLADGMAVLVTGGGGFLGRSIVRRLLRRDLSVRSFSRRRHDVLAAMGIEQIQGDVSDLAAVAAACKGVRVVFHTAAKPPPWGHYADYFRTNVEGTKNILQTCRRQGVKALVHTSSPSVIFDGGDLEGVDESVPYPARYLSPYAHTKALAEQAVREAAVTGLPAVVLRPHEIWGPEDPHFVPRIIARGRRLKQIGNGRNRVDTVYIDNAADAHLAAAERLLQQPQINGRVYFISQDEPVPAWDMINMILKAAGLDPVKGRISYRLAWTIGAICEGFWAGLRLRGEPPMTRFVATALVKSHWFDISAAKRDLDYVPRISIAEGMERLSTWLRSTPPTR